MTMYDCVIAKGCLTMRYLREVHNYLNRVNKYAGWLGNAE